MTRTVFAVVVAAMLTLAVSVGSQAAPIAPLGSAVTADQSNVTPVYWYHHRWYRHHRSLLARSLWPRALPLVVVGCQSPSNPPRQSFSARRFLFV